MTADKPAQEDLDALQQRLMRGAFAQALDEGRRLAARYPNDARLANIVGLALMQTGQAGPALDAFARAGRLDPGYVGPQVNRANLLVALRRFAEAETACRAALAINPDTQNRAKTLFLLGSALAGIGRAADALAPFGEAVEIAPDMAAAQNGLGSALARLRRFDEAAKVLGAASARWPDDAELQRNFANVLVELQRYDEAVRHLEAAVQRHPRHPGLRLGLVVALRRIGRFEDALAQAEAAVDLAPASTEAWGLLGTCQRELGNAEAAIAAYDKVLELEPDNPMALVTRWRVATLPIDHPHHARIEALAADPATPPAARTALELVLFNAADKADAPEVAFAHLARAKEISRAARPYDIGAQRRMFDALKRAFAGPVPQLPDAFIEDTPAPHVPIFIVGMPRSGTSLVEQILASHSAVHGGGELPALGAALARFGWGAGAAGAEPGAQMLHEIRRSYFDHIASYGTDRPMITDKTPMNFRWLGFALSAMPEARVLYTERDPRAVGWSNYSHSLRGQANAFGDDLADTAEMIRMHADLIAFWIERFPGRSATVSYERLTENQEAESRKLVAAVGLEWEAACLDFHKTARGVRTASSLQVRQKMYRGSSEAWRRYAAYLGPMLDRLGGEG